MAHAETEILSFILNILYLGFIGFVIFIAYYYFNKFIIKEKLKERQCAHGLIFGIILFIVSFIPVLRDFPIAIGNSFSHWLELAGIELASVYANALIIPVSLALSVLILKNKNQYLNWAGWIVLILLGINLLYSLYF